MKSSAGGHGGACSAESEGKPVIIAPSLSNEEAKQRFPQGWKELKPYLRVVEQPPLPR